MRSGITRRWLRGSLLITVLLVLLVEVMFLYSATRSYYNGVQQKRNTIGGAVNRRSPKNAFSEAASIFGLRLPLRGLKGASSPFLVDPARRNRWCFSGSLLTSKENN